MFSKKTIWLLAICFLLSLQIAYAATPYNSIYDVFGIYSLNNTADVNIAFQVRSCDDSVCSGESFVGPNNTTSTWFTTNFQSTIQWDLNAIPSNRYFQYTFHMVSYDGNYSPRVYNVNMTYDAIGVGITKIGGHNTSEPLPPFSYAVDGNLTIDFNVFDTNNNRLIADINYSTSNLQGTGTAIVQDLNLVSAVCSDQDWNDNPSKCSWDWNIFGVVDNNYYILIKINKGSDPTHYDFNASDNNLMVDNTPPVSADNDFNIGWNTTDQNILISCTDALAGCKNLYYSLDDINYQKVWFGNDQNIGIEITADANHQIWYWSDDLADNNENSHLIYNAIDRTAPTTTDNDYNNGWNSTDQNIQIMCTDTNSGCKNLYYSIDDSNSQMVWTSNDENIGIELTTDGNHIIWYWSDDLADNNENSHLIYNAIDQNSSNMVLTVSSPPITTGTAVTITYLVTGSISGIKTYWVREAGGNYTYNATNTTYVFGISSGENLPATHTYCVIATDNADSNSNEVCSTTRFESASGGRPTPITPSDEPSPEIPKTKGLGASCSADSECTSGKCISGICGECLTNTDCAETHQCLSGLCRLVIGDCGYVEQHDWIEWGCCGNFDCGVGEFCDLSVHVCEEGVVPKLVVRVEPVEAIEGQEFVVFVLDGVGNVVSGALIVVGGKQSLSDAGGIAGFVLPLGVYDLVASKQGFVSDARQLEVKRELVLQVVNSVESGGLVEIKAVDSDGVPVGGVEFTVVLPSGEMQVMKTNENGVAYLQSFMPGEVRVLALAIGFASTEASVSIVEQPNPLFVALPAILILAVLLVAWFAFGKSKFFKAK